MQGKTLVWMNSTLDIASVLRTHFKAMMLF